NVARGEMRIVGPRPERPEFIDELAQRIPNYRDRLRVHPGITGLAQINLPADDSLESVFKKTIVDCAYLKGASAMLDLRILICTALRMLGIRHGRAPRWMGVEYRFADALGVQDAAISSDLDAILAGEEFRVEVAARGSSFAHAARKSQAPALAMASATAII